MKVKTYSIWLMVLLLAAVSGTWAGSSDKIAVTVSSANGVQLTEPGNSKNQWFYFPGDNVCSAGDTITVSFVISGSNTTSVSVTTNVVGNRPLVNAITVTPSNDSPVKLSSGGSDPSTGTLYITIDPTNLLAGDYVANIQLSASPANVGKFDHDTIHIHWRVSADCKATSKCFFTDSSFLPLFNCDGTPVDVETEASGTFMIIYNKNKITATNPGQFYYNEIWTNDTGSSHTVVFNPTKSDNLSTAGTNSLHAYVFTKENTGAPPTQAFVATSGTPCGTGTQCKTSLVVNDGDTLYLTWHVQYNKVGQPSSSVPSGACPGSESIWASVLILDATDQTLLANCSTQAWGYLKPQ